jgi:prophage DNA circulation protein
MDAVKSAQGTLARLNALRGALTGTLGALRSQVQGIVGTTLDLINYPQAFAADVVSYLSGMADLRSFNVGTILADWKSLAGQLSNVVQLPAKASTGTLPSYGNGFGQVPVTTTTGSSSGASSSGGSSGTSGSSGSTSSGGTSGSGGTTSSGGSSSGGGTSTGSGAVVTNPAMPLAPAYSNPADITLVTAFMQLAAATQLADTASGILADEADDPTLTPDEIEQITDDTRTALQASIDQYRQLLPVDLSRPITEGLKDTALAIQTAAISVINQRPPLTQRMVTVPGNLHLTAFRWYGDSTRADELARLNPQITNPNFLQPGVTLNAYAS